MRPMRAWSPFLLILLATAPAGAQQVVTSARPEHVAVTLYRNPYRSLGAAMDPDWLSGFALVTETRQVALPAGETELRFEGVAGGIRPQSAIVVGLPDGVIERNRDAMLLSPESLLDRSLGRRVHLRRTSGETGRVQELDALVRTGADGAVLVQTGEGTEALRCTGLRETLVYDGVPAGLSTRPTLSVRTRTSRPVTATVTLAYLASGFDWQANYVARLAPDGAHIDLFGWLVLGSNDETSFPDADTQAVAGRLNRVADAPEEEAGDSALRLNCWPAGTTSDIPLEELERRIALGGLVADQSLVLLNGRVNQPGATEDVLNELPQSFARQENLGDLKLYRIPQPVTVAARSLKQVAFLERTNIPVEVVYRNNVDSDFDGPYPAGRFVITRNIIENQLGVALPDGQFQIFRDQGGRPLLAGEGGMRDYAVGERVEIGIGEAAGVHARMARAAGAGNVLLTVTNDQSYPVRYEALFEASARIRPVSAQIGRRDGKSLWTVTIPANGTATLRFRAPGWE